MKSILYDLFGSYEPVTYEVVETVTGAEGELVHVAHDVIPDGLAGVDIEYVAGVLLFGIVLYGFLRIVGGFLKHG